MHKYGIRIPKSVKEAIELDTQNGNNLWWMALMDEMKTVRPGLEIYEGKLEDLVGYQKVRCHIIWDIKLGENFHPESKVSCRRAYYRYTSIYHLFLGSFKGLSLDSFDNCCIK